MYMQWVSTGDGGGYSNLVVFRFISNMAAPRSRTLQPRIMDLYPGCGAIETLLVSGHRISLRYPNLLQRAKSVDGTPDCSHFEVLLLGDKPTC